MEIVKLTLRTARAISKDKAFSFTYFFAVSFLEVVKDWIRRGGD